MALGIYPATSLKEAREKRDTAKKQIDGGIDPNENKKAVKQSKAESAANSFEVIAREWYERNMSDKSESHKKRSMRLMATDLYQSQQVFIFKA
ncbi:MAG: Arm DNA-binding domain-containing protein [Methylovulum sp.]|nr:integrase arm-type DNA-binding domain-containing protein [Methylovulum sp.]MDD2723744.1 Arm DNA-binding domain-containing protein [Methylovulum sp.]